MYTVTFNKLQINNLKAFLSRTQLEGREAPAFVELLQLIASAKEEEPTI